MPMIACTVGHLGRARVWSGELPDLPLAHADVCLRHRLAAEPSGRPGHPVCVEVALPRGPRQLYGLLGGEFARGGGPGLDVEVPAALEPGPCLAEALSKPVEEAYVGLTPEYAEAVIAALASRKTPPIPPAPGVLRYTRAAQGIVGSAPMVFATLATLVVELMFAEASELDPASTGQRLAAAFGVPSSG